MKCPDCHKQGDRETVVCYISSYCDVCHQEKWTVRWRQWPEYSAIVHKLMCAECWVAWPERERAAVEQGVLL